MPSMTFEEWIITLPVGPTSYPVYAEVRHIHNTVSNPVLSRLYSDSVYGTPSIAARYVHDIVNCNYFVWEIPSNVVATTAKSALLNYLVEHRDILSDDWCNDREGGRLSPYAFAGYYYSVVGSRVISSTLHTCAHCALKAANVARGNNADVPISILTGTPCSQIDENYLPQFSIEVSGEAEVLTSATIKDVTETLTYGCSSCGRVGHNSRGCEYKPKHFDKIGIEIEGRYNNLRVRRNEAEDAGLDSSSDGSIRSSPDSSAAAWEFKTKPGSIREGINQLIRFYPDETDKSCGMHVHVSFLDITSLTLLQTKAFYAYFKKRWSEWATKMNLAQQSQFYQRLDGNNDYCNPNLDELRDMTACDRYMQLNFSSWVSHKTLECRLLPMFRRSSLGVAAVQELLAIYEDFLCAPEECGLSWADLTPVAVTPPTITTAVGKFELTTPEMQTTRTEFTLELEELSPPTTGMVRIAFPINQPITVKALADRLSRNAA